MIIQVEQLPQSAEGFIALRDQIAHTPQGGAAMMIVALLTYAEDEELGRQCAAIAVDRGRLQQGIKGYQGWQLSNRDLQLIETQIGSKTYIPRSYIKGTTPKNGYQLPSSPYQIDFPGGLGSEDPRSGRHKLFVLCSGASSPRPITLKRNDKGIWKAAEWSSLIVGVREPATGDEDDL